MDRKIALVGSVKLSNGHSDGMVGRKQKSTLSEEMSLRPKALG